MRILKSLAAVSLLVTGSANAMDIPLINAGFESPGGAKTVGDGTWSNIGGWTSTGPSVDSGLETFDPAPLPQPEVGNTIAFIQSNDGAVYQSSSYTIQSGDRFAVSFFERSDFNATDLAVRFYYDDGAARTVFNEQVVPFAQDIGRSGPLNFQGLSADAPPEATGSLLGIEFENVSSDDGGEWGWIDSVSLRTIGGPGDVNDDGFVDFDDYVIIRDNFRNVGVTRAEGDLVVDGVVNFDDFIEWRQNATPSALAAAGFVVPEPSTAAILLALTAVLGSRRRVG